MICLTISKAITYYIVNNTKTIINSNITDDIITYSSALSKNLNSGSPFEIIRYICPSSIQEKVTKYCNGFTSYMVSNI